MTDVNVLERAEALTQKLIAAGATHADVLVVRATSLDAQVRLGEVEEIEQSEGQDVALRAMVETKDGLAQASVASTELSGDTLDAMIERVVAMAKLAPADPYIGIADESALAREINDLDLADEARPSADALSERAKETEEAARAHKGITNSEGAGAGYGEGEIALATSNGFAGTYRTTSYSLSCSVLAGEGLQMERDYAYRTRRHLADLASPQSIGDEAATRTLNRLGAEKPQSTTCSVVFDPRVSGSLAGHMASALNGSAIARKSSFWMENMGEKVAADAITLVDDPALPRGLASRPFDGEGTTSKKLNLVEKGVIQHWLLDLATAKQLGLQSNGRARRAGGSPNPGANNLYIEAGALSPTELMADIEDGIYVTEMIGSAVSLITGDYSRGAAGFRIKDGKLAGPVSEFTVAGNLNDMFLRLQPASDLTFDFSTNAPTLRIDDLAIAGA